MGSKELIKRLEASGWQLIRVKGSHHIFSHPDRNGHITVPHPRKDLGVGLSKKIQRQAGLE